MQQLLIIGVEGKRMGWPIADLSEVLPLSSLHPLPGAYPCLMGMALHRGRLLTLVDLRALLDLTASEEIPRLFVRLADPADHLAIGIPEVEAVIPYSEMDLRAEEAEGLWAGLYPWEESWISVVQPEAVVDHLSVAMSDYLRSQSDGRMHAS